MTARDVRKVVSQVDGVWVRVYRDGTCWCGIHGGYGRHLDTLTALLTAAGYQVKREGQPGTAGAHILTVTQTK